jgi:hypothetical protein
MESVSKSALSNEKDKFLTELDSLKKHESDFHWVTDLYGFQIVAGKVYLSPIVDCFDGM